MNWDLFSEPVTDVTIGENLTTCFHSKDCSLGSKMDDNIAFQEKRQLFSPKMGENHRK
jgi:hypothetical protein